MATKIAQEVLEYHLESKILRMVGIKYKPAQSFTRLFWGWMVEGRSGVRAF